MPNPLLFIWQGSYYAGGGTQDPADSASAWAHAPLCTGAEIVKYATITSGSEIIEVGHTEDVA